MLTFWTATDAVLAAKCQLMYPTMWLNSLIEHILPRPGQYCILRRAPPLFWLAHTRVVQARQSPAYFNIVDVSYVQTRWYDSTPPPLGPQTHNSFPCRHIPTGQGLKRRSSLAASNEGAKALEQAYKQQFAAAQSLAKNYQLQPASQKQQCAGGSNRCPGPGLGLPLIRHHLCGVRAE
jgi:hypothetical protein